MDPEAAIVVVFAIAVLAGIIVVVSGMRHRAHVLEMAHKERLAMIERGIMPPPERDPATFDDSWRAHSLGSQRMLSAGIVMMGFGIALGMLITFAGGAPGSGIGVGGAIALIGAAFVVNARFAGSPPPPRSRSDASQPPRLPPPE
jgi:hypothetical protein